ncbi:hypothetical protein BJL95_00775 [Methylomonas sp. LWB]|uniref:hypothetical protein n=1 Tax=Methylomonas sp. LWB TaxID=1905845 RepID=UPI0008DA81F9|nr:hypothetical protein [Methylomonas sp. LWB]OHX35114.1 hypothetical protein BJL95_00775 [Methylomonas sp. LWB]
MTQNLISINFTDSALAEIDTALSVLENHFSGFLSLSPDERRNLAKMGDKTEAFCRQTLIVSSQNRQALPPSLDMGEAVADLTALDQLRPRLHRLRELMTRGDDTDMALGSDIYSFCLDAYASLKIAGKGAALETLREAMSVRFNRGAKAKAAS